MTNRFRASIALFVAVAAVFGMTASASAATTLSSSLSRNAWIPYWKLDGGIKEARQNLDRLTSVSAFGFEVDASGGLVDRIGMDKAPWENFMEDAKDEGVKVYGTVTWFNGAAMQETLSSSKKRKKHIDMLMRDVIRENPDLDGIEIDYEGKLAETNPHFSRFLSELAKKLHAKKKRLICDIEARTPLQDRYAVVTPQIAASVAYANDYKAIGAACDEVRIMAYDQGLADVTLVRNGSKPYAPVSDVAWVRKVMASTTSEIAPKKVVMGIPTYGRVWRIDAAGGYTMISSLTYPDAIALAARQGVVPTRNRSGELAFSYSGLTSGLPGTATPTGVMNRYFVSVSDSLAIASHVDLAKSLGLGGVALFKLDGATDSAFWGGFLR